MFPDILSSTPLTTSAANDYFTNITGEAFQRDQSMLATLRAILYDRIGDGSLYIAQKRSTKNRRDIENNSVADMMHMMFGYIENKDTGKLYVHNLSNTQIDDNQACLDFAKAHFEETYSGWTMMPEIENVLRPSFPCICFINRELRSTVLIVRQLTPRKYHAIASIAIITMPWYYDREKHPVDDEQRALSFSLQRDSVEEYMRIANDIAARFDFKSARTRKLLAGFETRYEKMALRETEDAVQAKYASIQDFNNRIGSLFREIDDLNTRILGLQSKIASGGEDSEILDYFLCNKHLNLYDATDRAIQFEVSDYLTYFDEDCAQSAIDNPTSFVYSSWTEDSPVSKDDMARLMRAIFIDEKLRIKTCAAYKLELRGGVEGRSGWEFDSTYNDCLRNPHIYLFSCMGNYTRVVNDLLQKHDYVGAIEQCIASAKSLNWTDSTVMNRFFKCMYDYDEHSLNRKCIELPDGSVVKPEEAVAWLNEQEHTTQEETHEEMEETEE